MRRSFTLLRSSLVLLVLCGFVTGSAVLRAQCLDASRNAYPGFTIGKGGWRVDRHPRRLADVNGDGMADIVGFSETNTVVAFSSGETFRRARLLYEGFTAGKGGWSVGRHPRLLADVTGSGRADLVGFGEGNVVLAASTSCFELGFSGPESIVIFPGAVEALTYTCTLRNVGPGSGAEAWSYGVMAENATIKAIRFAETEAQGSFENGFEKHEVTDEGATASVALSFGEGAVLAAGAPVSIAYIDVEVDFSEIGPGERVFLTYVDLANSFGRRVVNEVVEESIGQSPRVRPFATALEPTPEFKRGDVNTDGTHTLSDSVMLFNHLFKNEPPTLNCRDAADANDSNDIDLTDGIVVLRYLFAGDAPPASPFPECGIDPSDDEVSCELYRPCD